MKKIFYIIGIISILPSFALATEISDLDPSIKGNAYCASSISGEISFAGDCDSDTLSHLFSPNKWAVVFPYGKVYGKGVCSEQTDEYIVDNNSAVAASLDTEYDIQANNNTGLDENNFNTYDLKPGCWCKMEYPTTAGSWVLIDTFSGTSECLYDCTSMCAQAGSINERYRAKLFPSFPAVGDSTVTSKSYVDTEFSDKQTKLTGTDGYLALYGAVSGLTGERQIVTSLGTSTSATTLPTSGAVYTGLSGKQNKVSGTANYVMVGTSTSGSVSEKPIYSNSAQYMNALIETGTLNTAVRNAANNELTCYDNDCTLWQINTTGPTTMVGGYDPSVNQTSYCCRRLNGSTGTNGSCSTSTLTYLGTDDAENKSGKWGKVFPYGNISGISVCSTISGTANTAATDAQTTTLNEEYTAQAGVGDNTGFYCWCKMINPSSSKWVYYGSRTNASTCASSCASYCGSTNTAAFRTALYNSVQ